MSRTYISFLGTNDYLVCNYEIDADDFKCPKVRFVQEATIRYACGGWTSEDRILIFTTNEAHKKNWVNNGHVDHKTGKQLDRKGLRDCLSSIQLRCKVKQVKVPEGKSEKEIWEIFTTVFESLENHDEVIFDITHAFRSIPMLAIVILNYAKVMKNISILGIYYGAFEVLGSRNEAEDIPLEKRNVPILDLTAFDQLMDWAVAVDRFAEAGDAGLIDKLARGGLKQILAKSKGKNRDAVAIRDIGNISKSFCAAMATCRVKKISEISKRLKSRIKECENTELLPPFRPLFKNLEREIEDFCGDTLLDGLAAARWCVEHNLIQQSATILREVVISYLVSSAGRNIDDSDERKVAASAINIAYDQMFVNRRKEPVGQDIKSNTERYLRICAQEQGLVKVWKPLSQLRNDLNHAAYVKDPKGSTDFAKKIPNLIEQVEAEFRALKRDE